MIKLVPGGVKYVTDYIQLKLTSFKTTITYHSLCKLNTTNVLHLSEEKYNALHCFVLFINMCVCVGNKVE